MKSAGTTVPTAAAAVWRVASKTICNCERNWALVPEWSVLRNTFSQKRRRVGSSG